MSGRWFKKKPSESPRDIVHCSFCGKSQENVRKIVAAKNASICDECVDICQDTIAQGLELESGSRASEDQSHSTGPTIAFACALCGLQVPAEDSLLVPDRGALCAGCVEAVQEALR